MKLTFCLKRLYWDLKSEVSRFNYLNVILSNIPGDFGLALRTLLIPRYFKQSGENVRIQPGVRFCGIKEIVVGDNVFIGPDNFLQASGGLTIGDDTIFGPGVKIWTQNHNYEDIDTPIREQGYQYNPVTIGKNVWICANVFIMPGVRIPDGCVISAGSVVSVKKYPPYSLIMGNPARVIGSRLNKRGIHAETT